MLLQDEFTCKPGKLSPNPRVTLLSRTFKAIHKRGQKMSLMFVIFFMIFSLSLPLSVDGSLDLIGGVCPPCSKMM